MYWYFYYFLTKICVFALIFWAVHIVLFIISCTSMHRPGRIFFLIPGALFCIHDLRYEFFGGPFHCNIVFIIIEIILLIIGAIVVLDEGSIIDLIISLIQGYIFGVMAIMIISFIGAGIVVSIIVLIFLFFAAALFFSQKSGS